MLICPNCSYKLVLLPNRRQYKCALCSRLYPQKQAEDKAFQKLNLRERKSDREKLELELKKLKEGKMRSKQKREIKRIERALRLLFNGSRQKYEKKLSELTKEERKQRKKEYGRNWRLKNRGYDQKRKQEYYRENKDKIIAKDRLRRQKNLKDLNKKKTEWRNKNIQIMRLCGMIQYYRRKQKALAVGYLENGQYKPSTANIFHSVPIYALCELLVKSESL